MLFRESKRTKQVLISIVVTETDIQENQEEIEKIFIKTFSQGTKIGDRGLFVESLSMIFSTELSGGYKEGD